MAIPGENVGLGAGINTLFALIDGSRGRTAPKGPRAAPMSQVVPMEAAARNNRWNHT